MRRVKMRTSPTGWRLTWRSAGWRPWIAPESIQPGEKWVEAIGRGLDGSGVFVVALTPAAIASRWVKTETNAAVELENRGEVQFIPLDVAACSVPILWSGYQRVSFRGRYGDGLRALLARLGKETGRQVDKVPSRRQWGRLHRSRLLRPSACRQWCVQRRSAGRLTSTG